MFLLMNAHFGFPVHYDISDEKSGQTIHSVQCECMLEYKHVFRHHPGADDARAQVRPEQHTLISV